MRRTLAVRAVRAAYTVRSQVYRCVVAILSSNHRQPTPGPAGLRHSRWSSRCHLPLHAPQQQHADAINAGPPISISPCVQRRRFCHTRRNARCTACAWCQNHRRVIVPCAVPRRRQSVAAPASGLQRPSTKKRQPAARRSRCHLLPQNGAAWRRRVFRRGCDAIKRINDWAMEH